MQKNTSNYQDYKVYIAFNEALKDARKNKIHMPIDKIMNEIMLGVMREVSYKTDRDYLNGGITKKIKQLFNF
jgi:hypothetical protein